MPRLDPAFFERKPHSGVPLFLVRRGGASGSADAEGSAETGFLDLLRAQAQDWARPFLDESLEDSWKQARDGLVQKLPLGLTTAPSPDSWCVWFAEPGEPPPCWDRFGHSFHLVIASGSDEALREFVSTWQSGTEETAGILVFQLPGGGELRDMRNGIVALVLSAWETYCRKPDDGHAPAFGLTNGVPAPAWIRLGIASFDWGREIEQGRLARRISESLRHAWLAPHHGATNLPGFPPPLDLLREILPRPELTAAEAEPSETATLVTLGAYEYALHLGLPPVESPMRRWYLPRQIWREHLRRLLRLRFRADLGHLPQLQRLLDIRLERLPAWFQTPLREALAPLPDSPTGFLQAVKARLEAARTLLRPWVESSVSRQGEAATDAFTDEISRRIAHMPSLAGGIARLLPLWIALAWVSAVHDVIRPPFSAWEGDLGLWGWTGVAVGALALTGGVAWFLLDRNHGLWRSFRAFADAIPVRVTDQIGSRLVGAIVRHARDLDASLQRDKERLEELSNAVASPPTKEDPSAPDVVPPGGGHLPEGWNERAFPEDSLGSLAREAQENWSSSRDLEGLLQMEPSAFLQMWTSVAETTAESAFSRLTFEQVADAARWTDPQRTELLTRTLAASRDPLPAGPPPIRCLITVPEPWRARAGIYRDLLHPFELRLPDLIAVSLAPVASVPLE